MILELAPRLNGLQNRRNGLIPTLIQRYVLRQILYVAVISLVALTAIIFVGFSVSLIGQGLNVLQIYYVIPYVTILSLPYALPSAFLLAAVFVFGRLSGHNEITAMSSSGVNVNHAVLPALLLSLLVSAGAFWVNQYLFPWSLTRVRVMRDRLLNEVLSKVGRQRSEYALGNYVVYVGGVDGQTGLWKNVAMVQYAGEIPARIVLARQGHCLVNEETRVATIRLYDGWLAEPELSGGAIQPSTRFTSIRYEIRFDDQSGRPPDRPKYLPLGELVQEIRELRKKTAQVRAQPAYAHVAHPSTARRAAQAKLDEAYRARSKAHGELAERKKGVEKIRTAVQDIEGSALAAQAVQKAALERRAEAEKKLAEEKAYLERLRADLKRGRDEKLAADRIAEMEAEIARTGERVASLSARATDAGQEVQQAKATVDVTAARLQDKKSELRRAEASLASLVSAAQAAENTVATCASAVSNLRILERRLDAEAEFHFRNAGAAACIVFMLIGIPLGIRCRQGSVIVAVALSFFAVLLIYYPLVVVGEMLAADGFMDPLMAQWMGSGIVGAIGLAGLTWGIRR